MTPATPAGTNALPQETDPSEPTIEPGGVPEQYGEPFHLPGNRLVFTDWTYVRPCDFGWYDDRGVNVAVVGDHGPTEAEFRRLGWPWGIRIVAQPAQRSGPVLTREFPWEANRVLIGTLIRDGGVYRAWGYSSGKPVRDDASVSENLFCYLESDDG